MPQFVQQQEMSKLLKLPPSTVKLWLAYYAAFISPVNQKDQVVYTEDVLNLFMRIKALRAERYHLSTIIRLLVEEGFPLYIAKPDSSLDEKKPDAKKSDAKKPISATEAPSGSGQEPELREVIHRISTELSRISQQLNHLSRK